MTDEGLVRESPTPLLVARELPGKGLGFVAAEAIEGGTELFRDEIIASREWPAACQGNLRALVFARAMINVTRELATSQRWASLPLYAGEPDFKFDLPMPESQKGPSLEGVTKEEWALAAKRVRLNSFVAQLSGGKERLELAIHTSVFNHSCSPSAAVKNDSVYALRRIAAGEEVCISYRADHLGMPMRERRALLEASHGFICDCRRCVEEEKQPPAPPPSEAYLRLRKRANDDDVGEEFVRECVDFLGVSRGGDQEWARQQVRVWLVDELARRTWIRPTCEREGQASEEDVDTPCVDRRWEDELRKALRDSISTQEDMLPGLHPRRMDHAALYLRTRPDGSAADLAGRQQAARLLRLLAGVYPEAAAEVAELLDDGAAAGVGAG
eukprot:Hpha_TRINITY_DN4110_c0_g1::TRINITY_DN4110_c0_g1_i1::g.194810::m.194810